MTEWKDKYLELSKKLEEETAQSAENEQLLCRAIVRLTIAVQGLDKRLDPHLKSLQKTAKAGAASAAFKHRLNELSDALVKASEGHQSVEAQGGPDLFGRLIETSNLRGKELQQLRKLHQQLVADPATATEAELDQLLRLLLTAAPDRHAEPTASKGMLGRLWGGATKAGAEPMVAEPPAANPLLVELLQRLRWPSRLADDLLQLQDRLAKEPGQPNAWMGVIEELSGLFARVLGGVENDLEDAERFLVNLNGRLQELNLVLTRIHDSHEAAMDSGRAMRESMETEVGGMREDADQAVDLGTFKAMLSHRLDLIQSQVLAHLQQEDERWSAATRESDRMRERMNSLEQEAEGLRGKLAQARVQAETDPLTGLPNRAAYQRRVVEEYGRWKRFGRPLTLLVWDIDHFKSINDTFGHQAGDKTLQVIGQLLASRLRETDILARFGGEEFVMVMAGTDVEQAGKVANAIREGIANKRFTAGSRPIPITISCGYSEFARGDSPEEVFRRADEALYQAKQGGRNCCVRG